MALQPWQAGALGGRTFGRPPCVEGLKGRQGLLVGEGKEPGLGRTEAAA